MTDIPPINNNMANLPDSQYRTALPSDLYLELQTQAIRRGLKPYGLTKLVMTKYLKGELIPFDALLETSPAINQFVNNLPVEIKKQVFSYYSGERSKSGLNP